MVGTSLAFRAAQVCRHCSAWFPPYQSVARPMHAGGWAPAAGETVRRIERTMDLKTCVACGDAGPSSAHTEQKERRKQCERPRCRARRHALRAATREQIIATARLVLRAWSAVVREEWCAPCCSATRRVAGWVPHGPRPRFSDSQILRDPAEYAAY